GDPTNLKSHSGNGILAGRCKNVVIEYCSATNNGWDMPRIGNGPVGIWTYEADSVTIQYCISYRNKTSVGGEDGGGYDFDGGVTNSIIQQCLSYDNQGGAFGIFQYAGASDWHDNIIRNNISENDGNVSRAGAGVFIWNGSKDKNQFRNLEFYNNIVYNSKGAVMHYDEKESEHVGFRFYNNIFVAQDELVLGKDTLGTDVFLNNNWWSLTSGFNMNGIKDFKTWSVQFGKEQVKSKIVGYNEDPKFKNAGNTSLTSPWQLKSFFNLYRTGNSRLKKNLPVSLP
ncbi:MAG: right-handed parallel beta-helix repeat-containing protein, partial [Segetibacter sp.]